MKKQHKNYSGSALTVACVDSLRTKKAAPSATFPLLCIMIIATLLKDVAHSHSIAAFILITNNQTLIWNSTSKNVLNALILDKRK